MAKKRFGLKEVANVIFFDINPSSDTYKQPVAFFDTLKVSTIENEAETAEATGGQGNNKLISWDFGRTANLTMSDALLSDTTIAMLAGQDANTDPVQVVGREQFEVGDVVELDGTPVAGSIYAYAYKDGLLGATPLVNAGDIEDLEDIVNTDGVMVFYEYMTQAGKSNQVVFSGDKFPSTYRVVGETFVRDENGVDHVMQFEIPKAKMQSTFSLTMDVENVGTFDFNLEVLMDAKSKDKQLYKLTRIDA